MRPLRTTLRHPPSLALRSKRRSYHRPRQHGQELVRRYIGRQLAEYYAQPADVVVGRSSGLDDNPGLLSSLAGEWHWRRVFRRLYEEREGHWLTPVELFRPHYSHILGNFCAAALTTADPSSSSSSSSSFPPPLEIVEIGGGRGTNAELVLTYLQETTPDLYDRLTYILVDSSRPLHEIQKKALSGGPHADKVRFEMKDLMDVAEGTVSLLSKSDTPTVVMGMEVLDNLPHDKIQGTNGGKRIEQTEIKWNATKSTHEEVLVPLSDPLLRKVIHAVPSYVQRYPSWIPSVACGVLHHVIQQRPNLGIVLADFDWLPASDVDHSAFVGKAQASMWAEGEPIVTDMSGTDHTCYLSAPPHCDILFPTDFEKMASFLRRCLVSIDRRRASTLPPQSSSTVRVEKQSEFLQRMGPEHVALTKSWLSGHNPLIHDFVNCSVLTLTPGKNITTIDATKRN